MVRAARPAPIASSARPISSSCARRSPASDSSPSTIAAEVLTREGKALATLPATLSNGQYQVDLPLRSLALGEYVLRFTARRGETSAMSTAGFAIIR